MGTILSGRFGNEQSDEGNFDTNNLALYITSEDLREPVSAIYRHVLLWKKRYKKDDVDNPLSTLLYISKLLFIATEQEAGGTDLVEFYQAVEDSMSLKFRNFRVIKRFYSRLTRELIDVLLEGHVRDCTAVIRKRTREYPKRGK